MDQTQADSLHTSVTKDTASTPGYFRLFVPGMMSRYILRSAFTAFKEFSTPSWLRKHSEAATRPLFDYIEGHKSGPQDAERAYAVARRFDPAVSRETLAELHNHADGRAAFKSRFLKDAAHVTTDSGYDLTLGAGSVLLTSIYAARVASDMKSVFAETVALESGKKPQDITLRDLFHSDNVIVRSTAHNFVEKNIGRYGTDLMFFGRQLSHLPGAPKWLHVVPFGDLGVGVKGAQLMKEITSKETTIFEDLVQLIDKKLNPVKGMGDPISTADVMDIYQKYAMRHDKDGAFKDATIRQRRDGMDWGKAERLFSRIADLMNQTYKYKHSTLDGVSYAHRELQATSDFALPKLLYLLGHGMIDPYKPEQSLAYVEVANRYGIEAVKSLKNGLGRGMPFAQALQQFPIDIEEVMHAPMHRTAVQEVPAVAPAAAAQTLAANSNQPVPQTVVTEARHEAALHQAAQRAV